jgi:hypothetical protein
MSEDKQKQEESKKDPTLLERVRQIVPISLYQLITRWLDDEDAVLVHEEFPFHWFGPFDSLGFDHPLHQKHSQFPRFVPYVYRSELSTYFGPKYKVIYWNSSEFRRGICIFLDDGACVGFTVSGNGTPAMMRFIQDNDSRYEQIVEPIIQAHKSWLNDVESIHQK